MVTAEVEIKDDPFGARLLRGYIKNGSEVLPPLDVRVFGEPCDLERFDVRPSIKNSSSCAMQ